MARQKDVDARMAAKRRASPVGQLQKIEARARDLRERASILPDGDVALRLGAVVLNEHADDVAEQVRKAIEDPDSLFHADALAFVASRILPQKIYTDAARRLARSGDLGERTTKRKRTPQFVLTVGLTHGPENE